MKLYLMIVKPVEDLKVGDEVSAGTVSEVKVGEQVEVTVLSEYTSSYPRGTLVVVEE